MSQVEERLLAKGFKVPVPPSPAAVYVPVVQEGSLLFVAGQVPFVEGKIAFAGKVGRDLTLEQGQESARICVLNAIGVLKQHLGDLDRVKRVVKVNGYVNSPDDFTYQHLVINGASELLEMAFADAGRHARTAIGTNVLPLNAATEVEIVVSLKEGTQC